MRLLNTSTLEFKEFFDANIPRYAILSHRWGDEEVSYADCGKPELRQSKGYNKIFEFCRLSERRGLEWGWVDTCCIDKSSSAELSEAINAMHRWYSNASTCIVYMSDVTSMEDFRDSKWFFRGWTLQELLAPRYVEFFSQAWKKLGNRDDLAQEIEAVTNISSNALEGRELDRVARISSACIYEKMSWASGRETSRAEDAAYCLIGLFHVNMPLLYGEGGYRAFRRLQIEIMNVNDDETIYAWTARIHLTGMLPSLPQFFRKDISIRPLYPLDHGRAALAFRKPVKITNKGLQMQVHLIDTRVLRDKSVMSSEKLQSYIIPINCRNQQRPGRSHPLLLKVVNWNMGSPDVLPQYVREGLCEVTSSEWERILSHYADGPEKTLENCPMTKIYLKIDA